MLESVGFSSRDWSKNFQKDFAYAWIELPIVLIPPLMPSLIHFWSNSIAALNRIWKHAGIGGCFVLIFHHCGWILALVFRSCGWIFVLRNRKPYDFWPVGFFTLNAFLFGVGSFYDHFFRHCGWDFDFDIRFSPDLSDFFDCFWVLSRNLLSCQFSRCREI